MDITITKVEQPILYNVSIDKRHLGRLIRFSDTNISMDHDLKEVIGHECTWEEDDETVFKDLRKMLAKKMLWCNMTHRYEGQRRCCPCTSSTGCTFGSLR